MKPWDILYTKWLAAKSGIVQCGLSTNHSLAPFEFTVLAGKTLNPNAFGQCLWSMPLVSTSEINANEIVTSIRVFIHIYK